MREMPKISKIEWALVLSFFVLVDLIQIIIDLFVVGVIVNRIIDPAAGMILAIYLKLRGLRLLKPSRIGGIVGTFFLELIPIVDALPLWSLDVIFNYYMYRKEYREMMAENQIMQQKQVLDWREKQMEEVERYYRDNDKMAA